MGYDYGRSLLLGCRCSDSTYLRWKMYKSKLPVTIQRIKLAIMANCRAGGFRQLEMKKLSVLFGCIEDVEAAALHVAQKSVTRTNAKRLLNWLLAVKNGEDVRIPPCFLREASK